MGNNNDTAQPAVPRDSKIVITGGAGLVGQNLVIKLLDRGFQDVHVIDKSSHNLSIARDLHPDATFTEADLARPGPWQHAVSDADVVVMLHAQIGGNVPEDFQRNNVTATENILAAAPREAYFVHVSSSVVESSANDAYSATKARQEELVVDSGLDYTVLRPTLMFGWFDRKHFGWLSRFMSMTPVFPIPGHGNYVRQPLYAGDFCEIILACIALRPKGQAFNISGKENP
ncbi:MAG: NAD(P)-dependent oxidoreductase [Halioglobus sp.]|nr:NAD(P)-dependent oxidoreductase [Halioglobus sp.]